MAENLPFPHDIKNVSEEEDQLIRKYYKGYIRPFVRVGQAGYVLPPRYADHASDIYNLGIRSDDIWVVTFSRSGTTWIQELLWLVANDLDYDAANATLLTSRFAFIEYPTFEREIPREGATSSNFAQNATSNDFKSLPDLPSPRYVKTHLPMSLLPPKLLDTAKVFYVARDPRDVAVSYFFMHKLFRYFDQDVEFKDYWELFKRGLICHLPILDHINEAWRQRDHPNMMFLFYEEMQKDLRNVIDRTCKFLGKDYSNEEKDRLANHLSFDNMKKAAGFKFKTDKEENTENKFMRKGKSGNWVNYFEGDLRKEAEDYMEQFYSHTDLRFPEVN